MSTDLFILNNFNEAVRWHKDHEVGRVYFSPSIQSKNQKLFFEKRLFWLKKELGDIEQVDRKELPRLLSKSDDFAVSTWRTSEEIKIIEGFEGCTLISSNHLLDSCDFDSKTFFTKFRNKVEDKLPSRYLNHADQYYDEDLIERLNFYFGTKESPSTLPQTYFETRNGLVGDEYSTQLSPYLSCGALNVKHLYNMVKDYESRCGANKSTYWIVFELLWRDFFYHSASFNGNLIFSKSGPNAEKDFSDYHLGEEELQRLFAKTDFMQAAYNELIHTGFLSNRVRQIFASQFINDLELDWRRGAKLFEKYLIDYDVHSNWGNWQYLAGVGHDPRGHRYFDLQKQLERYDPDGLYIKKWI